ncbi:MAG TPA: multicopper oxidase [Rhodocyclaceae bacterium]|nr:multicopper oxidase [Rhodocyclaceae bacterium]
MASRRGFLKASLSGAAAALLAAFGAPGRAFGRERIEELPAAPKLLDPLKQPKFVHPLPNPLDPAYILAPTAADGTHYEVTAAPTRGWLGLVDSPTGRRLETSLWGYGATGQPPVYPGRSFVVQQGKPISVKWVNALAGADGAPLPHLLPVDRTLAWADPLKQGAAAGGAYAGPVPLVAHGHGGATGPESDGTPDQWATPGDAVTGPGFNPKPYVYDNAQEAALLWYHDHALGITRLNVYAGLAGLYVIRDANEAHLVERGLMPAGPYEVPLVIQDRHFTAKGELFYPHRSDDVPFAPTVLPEHYGNFILVNGRTWPVLEVEPRPYRLRLLNGSDSRFYALSMDSARPFVQIGTDLGLLDKPVPNTRLLLAPGERVDVIVDFTGLRGRTVILRNAARMPYPGGEESKKPDSRTDGRIMAFRVNRPLSAVAPARLPENLRPLSGPLQIPAAASAKRTRRLLLAEGTDRHGRLQPMLGIVDPSSPHDGTLFYGDPVTENPAAGDTEIWEFYNASPDAHPIHLHLVHFFVLDRQRFTGTLRPKPMPEGSTGGVLGRIRLAGKPKPAGPGERGRKDTVVAMPGEVTRIIASFQRPGDYVWHCHILSHEDHEMMRPFRVEPRGGAT